MPRVSPIVFSVFVVVLAVALSVWAALTPSGKQEQPPPTFPAFPPMPEVVPGGSGDNTPDGVWILNRETGVWRTAKIAEVKKGDIFDRELYRNHRQRCYAIRDIKIWPNSNGRSYSMEAAVIGEIYTDDDGSVRYIGEDWAKFIDRMNKMYPGVLPEKEPKGD